MSAYLFGDLKETLKGECWPDGVPENLWELPNAAPGPLQKLFVEAMMEIQRMVPSLQRNNTQIIPFCATYFQCGLTVFEAPRGKILNVRTVPRLNSSCVEDIDSPLEWCAEVKFDRIEYPEMVKILDRQLRCRCNYGFDYLLTLPEWGCRKTLASAFPAPTDANYCNFPELPMNFHYPSADTDINWRAKAGLWALYRNRIYLAPWINSTEAVVIDWDGAKRTWSDNDAVDTDYNPVLERAVKHFVLMNYFGGLRRDPSMNAYHKEQYYGNLLQGGNTVGALPELIHDERENTRALAPKEEGSHARMSGVTLQGQSTGPVCLEDCLPISPSGLGSTFNPGLNIRLTWTKGNGNGTQEIWRSIQGGAYALLATVASTVQVYSDLKFDVDYGAGDTVCYKIRGSTVCNNPELDTNSAFSTELCVVVP